MDFDLLRKAMKLLRGLSGLSRPRLRAAKDFEAALVEATEPWRAFEVVPPDAGCSIGAWLPRPVRFLGWWASRACRYSTNSSNCSDGIDSKKELKACWSGLNSLGGIRVDIALSLAFIESTDEKLILSRFSRGWRRRDEIRELREKIKRRKEERIGFCFSPKCQSSTRQS